MPVSDPVSPPVGSSVTAGVSSAVFNFNRERSTTHFSPASFAVPGPVAGSTTSGASVEFEKSITTRDPVASEGFSSIWSSIWSSTGLGSGICLPLVKRLASSSSAVTGFNTVSPGAKHVFPFSGLPSPKHVALLSEYAGPSQRVNDSIARSRMISTFLLAVCSWTKALSLGRMAPPLRMADASIFVRSTPRHFCPAAVQRARHGFVGAQFSVQRGTKASHIKLFTDGKHLAKASTCPWCPSPTSSARKT